MQTFFYALKGRSENKFEAKTPDVYCNKKYYNFYQQCEDHFATAGASRPNRIPFATFFLRDRIIFYW